MAADSNLQLKAAAPTDFWRKPPGLDVATAPTALRTLHSTDFHRARVTLSAPWTRLYDQGGLFLYLPGSAASTSTSSSDPNAQTDEKRFWVKTGIEFYNGRANLSTVAAREWADWSLLPLPLPLPLPRKREQTETVTVTVELAREPVNAAEGTGSSAWVYLVERPGDGAGEEETRIALREITWAFEVEGEISVGVYAARPTKAVTVDGEGGGDGEDGEELVVSFENLVVE